LILMPAPVRPCFRVPNVFYIHMGRDQYKVLDAPVLIQDAPPDATCRNRDFIYI